MVYLIVRTISKRTTNMIAIKINNKKEFMALLLTSELFDSFDLEEAVIESFNTFHIDGHLNKDFYKQDPDYSEDSYKGTFSTWGSIRPICFDLIKGKRTPLGFKFIFHASSEVKEKVSSLADTSISPDMVTLGINIRFLNGEIQVTTGTTFSSFILDKSIEKAWDSYLPSFLESHGIKTEDYA